MPRMAVSSRTGVDLVGGSANCARYRDPTRPCFAVQDQWAECVLAEANDFGVAGLERRALSLFGRRIAHQSGGIHVRRWHIVRARGHEREGRLVKRTPGAPSEMNGGGGSLGILARRAQIRRLTMLLLERRRSSLALGLN